MKSRLDGDPGPQLLSAGIRLRTGVWPGVASTSLFLKRHRGYGLALSDFQSRGYGRTGKSWRSEAGHSLCLSWCENTTALPLSASPLIALEVCRSLEKLGCSGLRLKWPNDVYLGRFKIAGILLEVLGRRTIIGIGINLRPTTRAHFAGIWRSNSRVPDRASLVVEIISNCRRGLARLVALGVFPDRAAWQKRDLLMGRQIVLESGQGAPFATTCLGIRTDGALLTTPSPPEPMLHSCRVLSW